jgi:hypothetical protein
MFFCMNQELLRWLLYSFLITKIFPVKQYFGNYILEVTQKPLVEAVLGHVHRYFSSFWPRAEVNGNLIASLWESIGNPL